MSWKKSTFSYLIWMIYTLITGTALVSLARMLCLEAGIAAWWGILAAALYAGAVGGIVFLLYKTAGPRLRFGAEKRIMLLVAESVLVAGLLILGTVLRIRGMEEAQETSVYFEMAEVAVGRQIPQVVHGAEHFYLRLLHGIFLLLGNQYMAGIWLQAGLQLAASMVFYFVVRKLAGTVSALVTFFFCMCSPYMLQRGLLLSPGMLYFLLLAVAAVLALWAFGREPRLAAMVFIGLLVALCCYLDIGGALLLILAAELVFSQQTGKAAGAKRMAAMGLCLLSAVLGLLLLFGADAFLSGKNFWKVAGAWFELYRAEGFRLPYVLENTGALWEGFIIFGMMAFGIFGFWYDRKRDWHLPYATAACIIITGCCFGIYTEEMPGFYALYLMLAMLAGVSMEQCICRMGLPANAPGHMAEEQDEAAQVNFREASETIMAEEGRDFGSQAQDDGGEEKKIRYLDNPLPLPKKHVKQVLDYSIQVYGDDDFDFPVGETDDFDV